MRPYPDEYVIERHELPFRDLPAGAEGLKLIHLSDLHVRRLLPRHRRLVKAVNEEAADLILLTGDMVSRRRSTLRYVTEVLSRLRARAGKFAVYGNWEHGQQYAGPAFEAALDDAGVRLLVNDSARVPCGGGDIYVVGLDDLVRGRPDPAAAFEGVPEDGFRILMAHEPAVAYHFGFGSGRSSRHAHLILAGHTHGGQLRVPFIWKRFLPKRTGEFHAGLYWNGHGSALYVNRGFGFVGVLPIRFRCPSEVAVITLRRMA